MPQSPRPPAKGTLFEPLVPQPAYGRVAAAIEQKIVKRTLKPGDLLPTETELARQFDVNRSTVREAVRRLESAGLVGRSSGNKRLRVTRPGHAETATRVSRALALDDVTFIELARGSEAAVAGVVEFFAILAAASGNRVLMLAMQPITRLLAPSLRRMIDRVPQGRSRILVAQRCIVEALRKQDAGEAESWMTRHVQDFRRGYEIAGIALDTRAAEA